MCLLHSFAAFCLIGTLFTQGVAGVQRPVKVSVFYESQCPNSRDFVVRQLLPAILRAPELIQPFLVPYGNATTNQTAAGYEFSCQHGPTECLGNKLHACAIALTDSARVQVAFAACMLTRYTDLEAGAESCTHELSLPYGSVLQCAHGQSGNVLLSTYGAMTKELVPGLRFVPTVLLNGEQRNQSAVLKDLWKEVSEVLAESSGAGRTQSMWPLSSLWLLSAVAVWKGSAWL